MDTDRLIYDNFLKRFEGKSFGNVGAELEFPLVNSEEKGVDIDAAKGVLGYFLDRGFEAAIEERGEVFFVENGDGDCLSFDNSYNNFEFSMNYGDDLCAIAERFYVLLEEAQSYFAAKGHALVGRGTNPKRKYAEKAHVNFSTYNMVDEFLTRFGEGTDSDFPAFISSAQTHLDVPLSELPRAYSLFAKTDFVRAKLFANSPDFEGRGFVCCRDYLWEHSAFSLCPNITGKADGEFESADDLKEYIMSKGMFNRIRDGKYETFYPVPMREYFARSDAEERDMECYLSFKNVEITRRGTLEIRSDCAQSFECALRPAAFNLGVLHNMGAAEARLREFFEKNHVDKSNAYLREAVAEGREIFENGELEKLAGDMLSVAEAGLKKRGKGEERLLQSVDKVDTHGRTRTNS